jgi:hypothetical protein
MSRRDVLLKGEFNYRLYYEAVQRAVGQTSYVWHSTRNNSRTKTNRKTGFALLSDTIQGIHQSKYKKYEVFLVGHWRQRNSDRGREPADVDS